MKKYLLFVILMLSCLSINAQDEGDTLVSLFKVNYEEITEFVGWTYFYVEDPNTKIEIVDDGLAVTNPNVQDQIWQPQVMVVSDGSVDLEEGHDYIVRLTLKVPSDGTYRVTMGSWSTNVVCYAPAEARDDFQIIDVEYPEYKGRVEGAHVLLGLGWVKGTTIIKEVEIFEKTSTTGIQGAKHSRDFDDTIYNLSGQKVDTSYKGIVIQNGKKLIR